MSARTVIVFLLFVSLVACRKNEQAAATRTGAPAKVKWGLEGPCSWLTAAEASEVIGQGAKQVIDPTTNNCNIEPAGKTGLALYYHVADNTGAYSFMKASRKAEDITGIGDKAVWDTGALAVVKGTRCLSVGPAASATKPTDAELKAKELALATKIVDRM